MMLVAAVAKKKKENQTEKNRMTFSGLVFEMSAYRPTEINLFDDDNIIIIVESCSNGFTRFSNIIVHLHTYSGAQTTEKCPRENRGQKSVKSEKHFSPERFNSLFVLNVLNLNFLTINKSDFFFFFYTICHFICFKRLVIKTFVICIGTYVGV